MNDTLKLIFVKAGINLVTRVASKVLPETKAMYPQTRILVRVFSRLTTAFNTERTAKRRGLEDHNFQRLLETSLHALAYISEKDRYYRQWLGLLLLLVEEEVARERQRVGRDEFVALVRAQWLLHWAVIREDLYRARRDDLFPVLLTDFLHTLA
jgi:hypothetical protein